MSEQETLFEIKEDWEVEWEGMPEYIQEKILPHKEYIVRFKTKEDVDEFFILIKQKEPKKLKSIWFPKIEIKKESSKEVYTDEKTFLSKSFINERPKKQLSKFVDEYIKIDKSMDVEEAMSAISETMKYYKENKPSSDSFIAKMEKRWYYSLSTGKPDYSVYSDKYYFADLWCCWIIYSRRYLMDISKKGKLSNYSTDKSIVDLLSDTTNTILDLGCGTAQTTVSLMGMFPNSDVYASNLEGSMQYEFCKKSEREYGFNLISDISQVGKDVDFIFASEYFEHIERPIEHLRDIIDTLNPKYFIIANAFGTMSTGHFIYYKHDGYLISQDNVSKDFNNYLRERKYKKIKTNLCNNRPAFWVKEDSLEIAKSES